MAHLNRVCVTTFLRALFECRAALDRVTVSSIPPPSGRLNLSSHLHFQLTLLLLRCFPCWSRMGFLPRLDRCMIFQSQARFSLCLFVSCQLTIKPSSASSCCLKVNSQDFYPGEKLDALLPPLDWVVFSLTSFL